MIERNCEFSLLVWGLIDLVMAMVVGVVGVQRLK
jgi:hypothetical protein